MSMEEVKISTEAVDGTVYDDAAEAAKEAERRRAAIEADDKLPLDPEALLEVRHLRKTFPLKKSMTGKVLSEQTLLRIRNLYKEGVVPAQTLDEAEANFGSMSAAAQAAKAEYDLALAGATIEDRQAAAAQVEQAQGAVDEVEAYIRDAVVYAPISGEVSTIVAEAGEVVGSGSPVVTILDLDDLHALFNIQETMLPNVELGSRFEGYVPALGRGVLFEVSYISPQADFATWNATRTRGGFDVRTFAVKARAVEGSEGLRPGMSVVVDWREFNEPR